MNRIEAHAQYSRVLAESKKQGNLHETLRLLTRKDPFFRLYYVLSIVPKEIIDNDWVYDRTREVQRAPWGYCDLWCREHFKTTIITQNGTIGTIINNPDDTTLVMSYTKPAAKRIIAPIVHEIENNAMLKEIFPEILWQDPKKQSPKWSQDEGYIIKRRYNPKEVSLLCSGLIDGQPTNVHYKWLRYDDVEVVETVRTPDGLEKCDSSLRMSYNLGITGTGGKSLVGTIYTFNDIHLRAIKDGTFKARIYPATKDGKIDGEPWLWTREQLAEKIQAQGPYISACQLFLNPTADSQQSLLKEWLRFWNADRLNGLAIYILVDPASEKKKTSDYTVYTVVGIGADGNYYVIRQIRDRLNLKQRANVLFTLHQQYRPIGVGYEKYGMQADIEYVQEQMNLRNYRFAITPLGGTMPKTDRIKRLVPKLTDGRIWLPNAQPYEQYDGTTVDLTNVFMYDEYLAFPFSEHDDMLDSLSRILDPEMCALPPQGDPLDPLEVEEQKAETYDILWSGLR